MYAFCVLKNYLVVMSSQTETKEVALTNLTIVWYTSSVIKRLVYNWKRTLLWDDNEQHNVLSRRRFFMPKNKFQEVVFTVIMATIMVYGMIVYNVALIMGKVDGDTFLIALHEMPVMVPIAFVLEFFVVGKLAKILAFSVMNVTDRPQFITYAISICICCIMCPVMSLIATILFKDSKTFGTFIQTWAMNFPMALLYQLFYCGPLVRCIFRLLFREKNRSNT